MPMNPAPMEIPDESQGEVAVRVPGTSAQGRPRVRAWRDALAATLVYGAWGFASNLAHGIGTALRVAAGQGAFSAVVTLVLAAALARLCAALRGRSVLAFAIGVVGLHGTAFLTHLAIGTPEILRTMAPGLFVGTAYVALFVVRELRGDRASTPPAPE